MLVVLQLVGGGARLLTYLEYLLIIPKGSTNLSSMDYMIDWILFLVKKRQ